MKFLFLFFAIIINFVSAITIGEYYKYKAYFGPFYIGEFSFEVKSTENILEQESYHIVFESNIKQVDKKSDIYLRTKDFKPVKVIRHYFNRDYETEIYDPDNNLGFVYHQDDFSQPKKSFQGVHELHTPMSLLLYLREQPLTEGNSFKVETTDEVLQIKVDQLTKINNQTAYKVAFEPMGLTVFYLKNNQAIIPEVHWRVFFHDVKIRLD